VSIKVGIIEDDKKYIENLKEFFSIKDVIVVETAHNYSSFLAKSNARYSEIELIILDINLYGGEMGLDGIGKLNQAIPKADIIILTSHDDSIYIFQALCNGAVGFLTKGMSLNEIYESIIQVQQGGSAMTPSIARKVVNYFSTNVKRNNDLDKLTPREYEIVEGIKDGLSYKLIADRYFISIETVRYHVKNIYRKLHVNSKSEVVNLYYKNNN
jgi:DNA-binding NarL/FixJ family response regulator